MPVSQKKCSSGVPNGAEICRSPGRRERKEGREKVRDGPWTDSEAFRNGIRRSAAERIPPGSGGPAKCGTVWNPLHNVVEKFHTLLSSNTVRDKCKGKRK